MANVDTVGHKKSAAEFDDVYARSLVGASDNQAGQGASMTEMSQASTQGNVTITGNPLDIAINGSGFYRMVDQGSGQVSHTRNGQFQTDKNGYVISAIGQNLTSYGVGFTGKVNMTVLTKLQIPVNDSVPLTATSTAFAINLDAMAMVPITTPFSATNSATFDHSVPEQVYDGTGMVHMLTNYYVYAGTSWNTYSQMNDNSPIDGNPATPLTFNTSGQLTSSPSKVTIAFDTSTGMSVSNTDFMDITQCGGGYNDTAVMQDGYATGYLASYSVGTDDTITGRYSNGRTPVLGQTAMANFKMPEDLWDIGGNQWVETSNSGTPGLDTSDMGSFGLLQSSAIKQSNVDLSVELVNMIVAQRSYQANIQTTKTENTILRTLVSLH